MPVTRTGKETVEAIKIAGAGKDGKESESEYLENLAQVPCIRYPIIFQKKSVPMLALLDSGSKVNAIHPTFAKELGLFIRPIDVRAQKIDDTTLDTFEIVVAAFLVTDKTNQVRFFEKIFLVTNISPEIVLGIFFFILNGANINFLSRELR